MKENDKIEIDALLDGIRSRYGPSIDVLFERAADVFEKSLIGVVMTGANSDGSQGLKTIKDHGGVAIVQNPDTAEVPYMPRAALKATSVDYVVNLEQLPALLTRLSVLGNGEHYGTGT